MTPKEIRDELTEKVAKEILETRTPGKSRKTWAHVAATRVVALLLNGKAYE